MSLKCQIFTKRLTFQNVLELSCDVRIIILFSLIAILPPNIKCAKLPNPQIRLLINDEDLLHEKTSRHEAGGGNVQPEHSGEHFNLYRSELKRLSYETIHRILRDENEPSYRREETELRYYQKRSPSAYEESHQLIKRSANEEPDIALNYSKRHLKEFVITPQLERELKAASSLDLSDNHLSTFNTSLITEHMLTLNLSNNSLTNIPLSSNSRLKSLNLNSNNIKSSSLPSNVFLHSLYLSSNSIENLASVNLSLLKNLETLDISCNHLKSLETSFFPERMHNLKHLNLAHNQLGSIYRETFYNLLSLNTLLLAHNNITDIDYETFLALPNLQYLDLSFNRLKGKSIRALQGITGLVALNIAFNAELGPYMQEFVASWSLKELDASGTGLCQIPAALAQSVRSLKLTHNWLKVINCGDLDSYPLLQHLDLSVSHIEHIEDDALGRLEILEVLMLDHNQITKIPISLPVSLEHLFLQNNNIMDIQSQSFQGLSSLKTLDLSHNKLLYLPDISLPKLQTLNLQSAEIRGISQGIVHTLPRLNELLLEENPIKCSDLLGIAEWASTCRLGSTKEELEDNGEMLAEEDETEGKVDLKKKFERMHNFYDKFEGEHCQKIVQLQELLAKPSCAANKAKPFQKMQVEQTVGVSTTFMPLAQHSLESQMANNLKRSSSVQQTQVENFNLNSMIAIPLPAKKAVKTLTETSNKTTTDDEVSATPALKAITSATPLTTTPAADVDVEQEPTLNKITKTYILATTTAAAAAPDDAAQTFKAFAFRDKPQEHSDEAKKTFAAASFTDAIEMADKAPTLEESQQHHVVGVQSTESTESLRAANLEETLKQIVAESIINEEDIGEQTTMTTMMAMAMTMKSTTTQMPPSTHVALAATNATAINSRKPETAMATKTPAVTTSSPTTTWNSKENLFKEIVSNEKEITTNIGPTKQIKSFETSYIAPAKSPAASTAPTTIVSPSIAAQTSSSIALPSSATAMPSAPTAITTHKELTESTTSQTVEKAISNAHSLFHAKATMAFTPTSNGPTTSSSTQQQHSTPSSTWAPAPATASVVEDKDLASNYDDIVADNTGQDKSPDNWTNGQDNNKTLVTLHITTPITPKIVRQPNESRPFTEEPSRNQSLQQQRKPSGQEHQMEHENVAIRHQSSLKATANDVNVVKCMPSNSTGCTSAVAQTQEHEAARQDIGKMPAMPETMTTPTPLAIETMAFSTTTITTTTTTTTTTAAAMSLATTHKHEPLQLHIKDRHLIGTPLLMHKGDNLMVATDELIKPNSSQNSYRGPVTTPIPIPTPLPQTSTSPTTSSSPTSSSHPILPQPTTGSSQTDAVHAKRKNHILDKSQLIQEMKNPKVHHNHEPFEHKGETVKDKSYGEYKKSNADIKTKKPSLIMKKMTIITKQHEADTEDAHERDHPKDLESDNHYQELKPVLHLPETKEEVHATTKHSTVNTPTNKLPNLLHEPHTFQHEHELLLQQVLHDRQQEQHEKTSKTEQWADLRKSRDHDNHPGIILLVSSGLFVVLLLGLMHVYRCDVPWRRNSPSHHLRPHQRHNSSLEDDVHSFLSYNEGMQKWHHSTRLEAPYSSPLHNLHVRELQKTSATEKPAIFKASSSYNRALNRTHILPRTNSQSSTATTRTTSPSSSAILDDETFYIEMTPTTGQFAQALQSELLPMELLNMAQSKHDTKETSADLLTSLEEDVDLSAFAAAPPLPLTSSSSSAKHHVPTRSDLLAPAAATPGVSLASFNHSNKTLYNSRKFGLW